MGCYTPSGRLSRAGAFSSSSSANRHVAIPYTCVFLIRGSDVRNFWQASETREMVTKECFGCGKVTAHRHVHDCAHDIPETHMAGTERFVCELCDHVTCADSKGAERFTFQFDKAVRSRKEAR